MTHCVTPSEPQVEVKGDTRYNTAVVVVVVALHSESGGNLKTDVSDRINSDIRVGDWSCQPRPAPQGDWSASKRRPTMDRYRKIEKLGEGTYGVVYMVRFFPCFISASLSPPDLIFPSRASCRIYASAHLEISLCMECFACADSRIHTQRGSHVSVAEERTSA